MSVPQDSVNRLVTKICDDMTERAQNPDIDVTDKQNADFRELHYEHTRWLAVTWPDNEPGEFYEKLKTYAKTYGIPYED